MTETFLAALFSIVLFGGGYMIIRSLKLEKRFDTDNEGNDVQVYLRDVKLVLADGTTYASYSRVLLTHFSDRVYHIHRLSDGKKELVVRVHLGDGMMLEVFPHAIDS